MPKSRPPLTVPTLINVPGLTSGIMTALDGIGRHHLRCDLCNSDITLTVTAHPRRFLEHRGQLVCLQARRSQGLPEPSLPLPSIPYIVASLAPEQLSGVACIRCPGLDVIWTPGSIWATYPYHQHDIRAVGWKPVRFQEEENIIVLRSDKCHQQILDTDEPPCIECHLIVNSANYCNVMERAIEVKDHTPWDLLTPQQTRALLQKMASTINTLRTMVLKHITFVIIVFN